MDAEFPLSLSEKKIFKGETLKYNRPTNDIVRACKAGARSAGHGVFMIAGWGSQEIPPGS